jgi:hypothetical protein
MPRSTRAFPIGHVSGPGVYAATITQPALFRRYLVDQIRLLIKNHGRPVEIGPSAVPIPLHFAFPAGDYVEGEAANRIERPARDIFDVPDLSFIDDSIVNGTYEPQLGVPCRWHRSRRRAWTTRSIGCRTTRPLPRTTSRTTSSSPTTSSTSTASSRRRAG